MSASDFQDFVTECVYDCFLRHVPEAVSYGFKNGKLKKFASEYPDRTIPRKQFMGRGGRKLVDIYAQYELSNGENLSFCFECKSSRWDLNSGYGLNFFADMNYVIIPKKVYGWADPIADAIKKVGNDIGVITIDRDSGILHTVKPCWIRPSYPYIFVEAFGG